MILTEADYISKYKQRFDLEQACLSGGSTSLGAKIAELEAELKAYENKHDGDRKGAWLPTNSCKRFWPEDPRPEDFDINDIAHSLARINRWNGHTEKTFSVAQHSFMVSRALPDHLKLFGLMHDAAECYLGDIITPIKRLVRDVFDIVEERVMMAVANKFEFHDLYCSEEAKKLVKQADLRVLATEIRDLTSSGFITQPLTEIPLEDKIVEIWTPQRAKREFLQEFKRTNQIGKKRVRVTQQCAKTPYRSKFAVDHWISPAEYLTEHMVAREANRERYQLPDRFWATSDKYAAIYSRQVALAANLLKTYKIEAIVAALRTPSGKTIHSFGWKQIVPLIKHEQERIDRQKVLAEQQKQQETLVQETKILGPVAKGPRPALIKETMMSKLKGL